MKEKTEKIKKGNNTGIRILLWILAGGYFLFFTSKIWMPNQGELIEATPLYVRQPMEKHEIYLTQWDYSEQDHAMEAVIEIEAKELVTEEIGFEAVDRTAGKLPTEAVTEHTDYIVLRITDVPEKWKEISIRLWEKGKEEKLLRIYTNIEKVEKEEKLPKKKTVDYDIDRLEAQITYDTYRISEHQKEIDTLTEENTKLEKRITELEEANYPSEDEAKKAGKTVEDAQSKMESNENMMDDRKEEIEELENRSEELEKQIGQLEKGKQEKRKDG